MSGFEVIAGGVPDCRNSDVRNSIVALEAAIRSSGFEVEAPPVRHIFAPGVYCREITLPKGITVVGKIHRHAHVNVISKGRVAVVTEFGSEILEAPITFVSEPGTKRAVTALEETIWLTVHPTEETDLAKIEEHVIAPSYEALAIGTAKPERIEVTQ